jgi:hypothetical protein
MLVEQEWRRQLLRELTEDMAMVPSEQHGLTRRQNERGWRSRGPAGRNRLWALAIAASLIAVTIVAATGCGSDSQASTSTSSTAAIASQRGPGGSMPQGFQGGPPSGRPGQNTTPSDSTTTTGAVVSSTTTTEAITTTSRADGQYGDGIYKAGTDIDADLYKGTVVSGTGHWEITSDAIGVRYVAGGDPTGSFYVKVTSGQYLRLSGVIIEEASSDATDPLASTSLTDGTYRVGYDIEEGWYTGTVTGESTIGYWQISTDANGQKLKASDYPRGTFTFKVVDGQYLTLRGVTVSLQE